jgi:adenylate kinase family enzyme
MHIHITGASGSGATTLGAALARELLLRHADADNYYWLPTSPPFKEKRNAIDRLALLRKDLHSEPGVVLSGSIYGWGSEVEDAFDLVVFLYLPAAIRVERLRRREIERYGAANPAFLEWASQYDEGPSEGRSLAKHNAWLAQRTCPVLRVEQDQTVAQRVAQVCQALRNRPARSAA